MAGGSVIYLIERLTDYRPAQLAAAQAEAINRSLPLAVVYCAVDEIAWDGLVRLETELAKFNLPLMVLIGRPEAVLPGFYSHVQPLKTYRSGGADQGSGYPVIHPVDWPGRVIRVLQLKNIVDKKQISC